MDPPFLPYGRHSIDEDDVDAVVAVLRSNWLTTGPLVAEFERSLAAAVGAAEAVVCSSATAALHLACSALRLGPGDAAIVPTITFLATANCVRFVGAEVVFADVDPKTGLLGAEQLDDALRRADGLRPRVVIPVHLGGQACDMVQINQVARRAGLSVVEDACHALGSEYDARIGSRVGDGRLAEMAVFSFHPVKTVAMGEGGAITTNDSALAQQLRLLRSHSMSHDPADFDSPDIAYDRHGRPNPWVYAMAELGYNYRASDLHCALGASQLKKLSEFGRRRRQLVAQYDAALADLGNIVRPVGRMPGQKPVWHLYSVLIDFEAVGRSRSEVMSELRRRGIGTQVHYIPVHLQPYYRRRYGALDLPGATSYYHRQLSLPLFPTMTSADVDRVVQALRAGLQCP